MECVDLRQIRRIDPGGRGWYAKGRRSWYPDHTIRGAISGALKKELGLNVEATRTREVGPNKTGAKGSSAVYRIVG